MNIKNQQITKGERQFSPQVNYKYLLLIILLFSIGGTTYLYFPSKEYSNEELFELYYQEPELNARGSKAEIGLFFKAMSHMHDHEYVAAKKELRETLNQCGAMHDHAQWYMMLCLLKTNSDEELINAYLCDIISHKRQYSKFATKILYYKSKQEKNSDNS